MTAVQKQIAFIVLVCILGAIAASWHYNLPSSDPKTASDQHWALPTLPDTTATAAAYNALSLYYPKTTATDASGNPIISTTATAASWVLQGLILEGNGQYALITSGGKTKRYRPGEHLPDNSVLAAITNNGITINSAGKMTTIRLHGTKHL
ncbi:MAG: hypothetical protein HOP34_10630 [Methylococcaceae bacterium]|nr:hypothetical protein [Methylococcaceae bacterium]